eukprot:6288615-Amphidinium_carterae.1
MERNQCFGLPMCFHPSSPQSSSSVADLHICKLGHSQVLYLDQSDGEMPAEHAFEGSSRESPHCWTYAHTATLQTPRFQDVEQQYEVLRQSGTIGCSCGPNFRSLVSGAGASAS